MILAIAEREIKESIKSRRFLLIFGFLLIIGALSLSSSLISWHSWGIVEEEQKAPLWVLFGQFNYYFTLLGAIFGIALGFDAITKEREGGTLKILLSTPLYKDQIILGKFLGGALTLGVSMLVIALLNLGVLMTLGANVTGSAILRIATYMFFVYLYTLLFLGIGIFFSIISKSSSNALISALVVFLILNLALSTIAPIVAYFYAGDPPKRPQISINPNDKEAMEKYRLEMEKYREEMKKWQKKYFGVFTKIRMFSPEGNLYEISSYVLNPQREKEEGGGIVVYQGSYENQQKPKEYSLTKSLSFVSANIVTLLAYILLIFVAAYIEFMRKELY